MSKSDEPIKIHEDDQDADLLASAIPIESLEEDEEVYPLAEEPEPLPQVELAEPQPGAESRIRALGEHSQVHQEELWKRKPNVTGHGAVHVKTFVAKLRPDAIEHLDRQINEWLDAHPNYEVKFVTTNVGELMAKLKEPALFVNVWV